jgi:hypothetical protein
MTLAAFYPGYMSPDSLVQLAQARSGEFEWTNPPVMAWVWRLMAGKAAGPGQMLVLQNVLFWTGLALVVGTSVRTLLAPALVLLIGLLPPVLALLSTVWKDVHLGAALMLAVGLMLVAERRRCRVTHALAVPALLYATAARHNALAATLPLGIWWGILAARLWWSKGQLRWGAVAGLGLALLAMFGAGALNRAIIKDRPADPLGNLRVLAQVTYVQDLVGISIASGRDELPAWVYDGTGTYPIEYLRSLYRPELADPLFFLPHTYVGVGDPAKIRDLQRHWIDAIRRHPWAWLKNRLILMGTLVGFWRPHLIFWDGIDANPFGLAHPRQALNREVMATLHRIEWSPIFRGWVYLALLLGTLGWAIAAGRASAGTWAVAASALAYLCSFFLGPADDFRYVWWLVLAALVLPCTVGEGGSGPPSKAALSMASTAAAAALLLALDVIHPGCLSSDSLAQIAVWWMLLAALVAPFAASEQRPLSRDEVALAAGITAASALLYLCSYSFAPASEFRALWWAAPAALVLPFALSGQRSLSPDRATLASSAAAAASGMLLVLAVFYPGYMSPDSLSQLAQARSGEFEMVPHPPIMSWVWRLLGGDAAGPGSMLVFQNIIFWAGLAVVVGISVRRRFAPALVLLLGLLPPVFALLGTIWKDVHVGAALVLAVGLMLAAERRHSRGAHLLATLPLFYATAVRHNGLAATFPLAIWWGMAGARLWWPKARLRWGAMGGCGLAVLALLGTGALNRALAGDKPVVPLQYIYVQDLVGISIASGRDELPAWVYQGTGTYPIEYLRSLYRPELTDPLFYLPHTYQEVTDPEKIRDLRRHWLDAIRRHPLVWLKNRFILFGTLLGFKKPHLIFWDGIAANPFGLVHPKHDLNREAMRILTRIERWAILRGWPYLLLLLGTAGWAAATRRATAGTWALAASAVLYLASYFLGPADDFRYIWWMVLAALILPFTVGEPRPASRPQAA